MSHVPDSAAGLVDAEHSPSFQTVAVRRAVRDDAALLHRVAAETFPLACPTGTLPESIIAFVAENLSERSFEGYLADPARELFIAEVEGDAAGYSMVVHGEPTDADVVASITLRPTAELSKLYVREAHHGGGIAAALVEAVVLAAAARGARSVWLGVNDENLRANRFYEKSGFEKVGTKFFRLGERFESDFVRERRLDDGNRAVIPGSSR
ncbi:GNAT family N-acetyltransferase [Salinibacterium sp.]|uniref:GNAT family N-acetyltransferase n=1 Tax=Salinibacterium sp. TaxID=1915057 RepID=UPI00286A62A0|nr:GNAT family N-acetyltransferase [Salinibacterium sp.]